MSRRKRKLGEQENNCCYDAAIKAALANNLDTVQQLYESNDFNSYFTGRLLQHAMFVDNADALVGWLLTVTNTSDVNIRGYIMVGNLRMLKLCVMHDTSLKEYVGFGLRSGSLEVVSFLMGTYPEIPAIVHIENASRNEIDLRVFPYVVRSMKTDLQTLGWVMTDGMQSLYQLEWIVKNQLLPPRFAEGTPILTFFLEFLNGEHTQRKYNHQFREIASTFKEYCEDEQKQAHESLVNLLPNPDLISLVKEYMSVMDGFKMFKEELTVTIKYSSTNSPD